MKTADLAGAALNAWIAKALGEPTVDYLADWPGFDRLLEREAIHVAPMPGKNWQWCAIVVGKPGGRLPEGRGPWLEGATPRVAVGRAIVAARYGGEVHDKMGGIGEQT
ncbi:hypothetical protein [Variovorax sp.]|uniref:hypothetical protein n=1 Tax=Variovorax sp. TaxID=1871043 RepID=UPI0037D9D0B0